MGRPKIRLDEERAQYQVRWKKENCLIDKLTMSREKYGYIYDFFDKNVANKSEFIRDCVIKEVNRILSEDKSK